jgi:predicted amidohydrolase
MTPCVKRCRPLTDDVFAFNAARSLGSGWPRSPALAFKGVARHRQRVRVAAVQFKATKGDWATSIARLSSLCREAAKGSDLVVLPEMAATGYVFASPADIAPFAELARGPTFEALAPIARAAGCWIVCGFPERDGGRLFNSALVIDDQGELRFCYRKTLLYEADETWALPGDSGYAVFETRAGSFTVGICMDLNDDRFTGWCRQTQPKAIAFPTNWLDQGEPIWGYWAWRLRGVQSALVAANTYGAEHDTRFIGASAIIHGRTALDAAEREGDQVIRAVVP